MLYLLLTSFCAAAIMIAMRLSNGHIKGRFGMLAVNYFICAVFSWINMGFGSFVPTGDRAAVAVTLGLINGFVYITALSLSQYNIPINGVVLSTVTSRLGGLIVPLAVAILLLGELPRPVQVVGAVIALVSVVVLNYDKERMSAGSVLPLVALFVADGSAVAMSKVFNNLGNPAHSANFLLGTFGVACLLCILVALVRREKFGSQELLYGTMVGVPNFFAARFLLRALETIPAIIVYPTRCVGGIAIVALFGVLYFGERLRRHQWYAMAAITVAIVLLNL